MATMGAGVNVFLAAEANAQQAPSGLPPNKEEFHREVKGYADLFRLPGLAVAVVQDGKIIYRQNEGYADVEHETPIQDDSIFWIASVTKTFSATIMMQYVQEGKVSLEDYLLQYPFTSVGFFPQRVRPDVKLKHVLSHTSERTPGDDFAYHGGRYNFIYGVFQKVSGQSKVPEAFPQELKARILEPLNLTSTLAGYPTGDNTVRKSRIIHPYGFDTTTQSFFVNRDAYKYTVAFPATGILSSIEDLATYTSALDDNRLLSKEGYDQMTSSFRNNKGKAIPYGVGWFTQKFAGVYLHWAYGFGDSDSALLLRVPERKLTLIFLSNCTFPSAACRLGAGDVLRSPFALSFLKHFVFQNDTRAVIPYNGDIGTIRHALAGFDRRKQHSIYLEELYTQALIRAFAERTFQLKEGKAEQLISLLYELDPARFKKRDMALIYLLSELDGKDMEKAAEGFIRAYEASRDFHPDTFLSIAKYYERNNMRDKALKYYHKLADTSGFEEQDAKIEACSTLGNYYLHHRSFDMARAYLWNATIYTRQVGRNDNSLAKDIDELNHLMSQK